MLNIEKLMQYCIDRYLHCPIKCINNEISFDTYINTEIKYKEVFAKLNNLRKVLKTK